MPQLDKITFSSQIIWCLITFTTLYVLLFRDILPKIATILKIRRKKLDSYQSILDSVKSKQSSYISSRNSHYSNIISEFKNRINETVINNKEFNIGIYSLITSYLISTTEKTENK